jgi:trk system potassium uptake protein TrkH
MQSSQLSPKRTGFTPSQIVVFGFLGVNIIGTLLLMLPAASSKPGSTDLLTAAFTSVSSLAVTGLSVVNTATHWTFFGQSIILLLIKVGGFGIMALGSLLALMLTQRISFKTKITSTEESKSLGLSDFKGLLVRVFVISISIELAITAILTLHLHFSYGEPWPTALWNGLFQSVAAFNNAGMSTYPDNLMSFV